jgi:hypothetical protein
MYPFGYLSTSAPVCKIPESHDPCSALQRCLFRCFMLIFKDLLPRRSLSAVETKGFAFWPIVDHIPLELVNGVHGSPVILLRDGSPHLISDENYPAIFLIIGSCAVLLSVELLIIQPLTRYKHHVDCYTSWQRVFCCPLLGF